MNQVIAVFGMEPMIWLRTPGTVWIALFVICLWRWTGVNMMYYLSGLQQIPEDLYESAIVDGASSMQKFRYVTLPLLKPTTVYVLTISIFGGMAMFSESFMLFNGNKSPNNVGTTLVGMLYRMGFEQNQLGIASAIGVVFLAIVLAVNAVQLIFNGFSKRRNADVDDKEKQNDFYLAFYLFVIVAAITLLPLALLAVSSLRPGSDLMRYGLNFSIDWANANLDEYRLLFSGKNNYFIWYRNSLIITVVQVGLALFLSACVGYGFAMYDFRFKNTIFVCVLLVMMVPTEVILLPLYRLILGFGLTNSMWGVILPYIVVPMLIFFFRQYLSGISKEFVEAARVDGCSEYGIFMKIIMPLMKPSFAAMGIYQGMSSWNNFLWPMIVINDIDKITLPVGLQSLLSPYGNNYDILIAGSCFAIIPILILFVCFQRYFIEGMTAGGVKG